VIPHGRVDWSLAFAMRSQKHLVESFLAEIVTISLNLVYVR